MTAVTERSAESGLGDALARPDYLRIRQRPGRRDGDYLSLSDLNAWIEGHARDFGGDVFDYGCGGAPYAALFARCRSYVRADVVEGPAVERLLPADGRSGEPDAAYDWVFSTQVLEHVPDPALYLAECHRILRPGGQLLLTTHGFYPEHGCPYDFHRWTSEGLSRAVRGAGFEACDVRKLTTGVRGSVQMLHHAIWNLRGGAGLGALALGAVRKVHGWVGVPLLNFVADLFPSQSSTPSEGPSALYIGVCVRARKPAGPRHG